MWQFLIACCSQSLLLAGGQVLLKFALTGMSGFTWSWPYFSRLLTNWWLLGAGLCFAASSVLWCHILKHYPFGMAYPMISLSYIFGLLAAWLIFGEHISASAWIGVALIMAGCFLIVK